MFDDIVRSNGWVDATVVLQLLSHLEGDALNVALLVPGGTKSHAGRVGQGTDGTLQIVGMEMRRVVYEGYAVLPRTGSDVSLPVLEHSVVGTFDPGDPWCGTGEAVETLRDMVVNSECRDTIRGTLEEVLMCRVNPRPTSELGCQPFCAVSTDLVQKQICFAGQRDGKHRFCP